MAETKPVSFVDFSKINPYDLDKDKLQETKESVQDQIDALERRYAQPNWFKVAAGFAKPQLGGFSASLGSAFGAMGENVEQQRAAALPIAQMRAQLAQSDILLGSKKKQSDEFSQWQATKKPMDQTTYARITALDPTSQVAAAAKAAYEGGAKDTENTRAQQRMVLDTIQLKQAKGLPLSKTENDFLNNFGSGLLQAPEAARASNIAQTTPSPDAQTNPNLNLEKQGQASGQTGGGGSGAAQPTPEKPRTPYPPTLEFPDVSSMSDPERKSREAAYQRNVESVEKESSDHIKNLRTVAADPVYSSIDSEYKASINLLKTQPQVAKAVFNLLRQDGSVINQVMTAAQAGFGVNLGSMAANLNLPVDAFARAGLNEEQQLIADRLVRAMLVTGTAKLSAEGKGPEKGTASYDRLLQDTKASLQQNAVTALLNLQKDYVTFRQNKQMYDQVGKEYAYQQKYSPTPYTDVIRNSPDITRINEQARKEMEDFESAYSQAIRELAEKRKAGKKR